MRLPREFKFLLYFIFFFLVFLNIALFYAGATENQSRMVETAKYPYERLRRAQAVKRVVEQGNRLVEMMPPMPWSYVGASKYQMHGTKLGFGSDGNPLWRPGTSPPRDSNIDTLLREGGGFNIALSDSLPLDRNISDSRDPICKAATYDIDDGMDASVVIVFYNEPFSMLLRSVHSVLNRTPPRYLREIVLVDDGGDIDWIRKDGTGQLEDYVAALPKTVLVRNPQRQGIVGARMLGIRTAKAPVFVILDSHIEVNEGWLEPMLHRIQEDPRRIMMPAVDGLLADTLEDRRGGIGCNVGFLWKLIEHSFDPNKNSPRERRVAKASDYVTSPTMAGGLLAGNKDFFFEVGAYDEKFEFWGTENLELSFRLWMCGGTLECAPCSRVYHAFRQGGSGYSSPPDAVTKNKMRLLLLWMDEYADLAWRVIGQPRVDFGEWESRRKWRREKNCRSFEWFLANVNPEADVLKVPRDVPYLGTLKNERHGLCLDNMGRDYPGNPVGIIPCHGKKTQQFMYFSRPKHIITVTNDETCLSSTGNITEWCMEGGQKWDAQESGLVRSHDVPRGSPACLGIDNAELKMLDCDSDDTRVKWTWEIYDPPKLFTPPPLDRQEDR